MGDANQGHPGHQPGSGQGGSQPATETQKPGHIPNSQGPGTKDTSDNAKTVQQPPRGK